MTDKEIINRVIEHIKENNGSLFFVTKDWCTIRHGKYDSKEFPNDYEWDTASLYYDGEQWIITSADNQELNIKDYGYTWHLYGDDVEWD